jgi:spoIIIJ-associated protein
MMTDIRMQRSQQWLQTLVGLWGISVDVKVELEPAFGENGDFQEEEQDSFWLTIDETNLTPEEIRFLIGSDGSVLDAIQYLANSILNLNQPSQQQASYTIELNGYRVKRQTEIRAMAEAAALAVRSSGKEVEIKSLSSAERRQVHTFLKEFGDLETFSRGKEPHRHLVVRLTSMEE